MLTQLDKKPDTPPPSETENTSSRKKQQDGSSSKLQQSEKEDQSTPLSQSQQEINPSHPGIVVSRNHDTETPQYRDTTTPASEEEILEAVRKTVKQIGKEAATQRLTLEEKHALKTIEFTYGQQGILTSGNEIIRIATNYILQDYRKNGDTSIVAKVLKRLNS